MTEAFRRDLLAWLAEQSHGQSVHPGITWENAVAQATLWAISDIMDDMTTGRLPASVRSFSELHDHVDANGYGGAFDWPCLPSEERGDEYQWEHADFWSAVQTGADAWLRARRDRMAKC